MVSSSFQAVEGIAETEMTAFGSSKIPTTEKELARAIFRLPNVQLYLIQKTLSKYAGALRKLFRAPHHHPVAISGNERMHRLTNILLLQHSAGL